MPQVFNKVSPFWLVRTQASLNPAQTLVVVQVTTFQQFFSWFFAQLPEILLHIYPAWFLIKYPYEDFWSFLSAYHLFSANLSHICFSSLFSSARLWWPLWECPPCACGLEISSKDKAEVIVELPLFISFINVIVLSSFPMFVKCFVYKNIFYSVF